MVRVLVVGPTSDQWVAVAAQVEADLARLHRDGVELTYRCTGAGPVSIRTDEDQAAAAPFVVQAVVDAAAEGFDAVIVDCTSDPGVDAAQRLVTIPVIGPGAATRAAIDMAGGPVSVLSGDDLRRLDTIALLDRIGDAPAVAFAATGCTSVADALREVRPELRVLDPLDVALDAALRELRPRFGNDDFAELARAVIDHWNTALDRDWSSAAGTLDWSCWQTADHVIDCVFSYALFLASRCQDDYPAFGELHALPTASPADLVDGLRAVTTMLHAVIATAEPEARAIILRRPMPKTAPAADFAARGGHELILHAYDIASGLGVPFIPSRDWCARLLASTAGWADWPEIVPSDDPWSDLLERSGRERVRSAD